LTLTVDPRSVLEDCAETKAKTAVRRRGNLQRIEGSGILRGHTQSSTCEARWMKIWSTPHSDMGVTGTITVEFYLGRR
jgi:hypothetical protein